jgi:hypothetical protein
MQLKEKKRGPAALNDVFTCLDDTSFAQFQGKIVRSLHKTNPTASIDLNKYCIKYSIPTVGVPIELKDEGTYGTMKTLLKNKVKIIVEPIVEVCRSLSVATIPVLMHPRALPHLLPLPTLLNQTRRTMDLEERNKSRLALTR